MNRTIRILLISCPVLAVPFLLSPSARPASGERLTVAAAASLQLVFREVVQSFRVNEGGAVTLVFGASGSLAVQISHGAPYDLFASADERWVRRLVDQGRVAPGSIQVFGLGVLALALSRQGKFDVSGGPLDGERLGRLVHGEYRVVALANPNRAPYGTAALQALERAGILPAIRPRLVYGDNVRQALTYLETGNADAALVAASLLTGSKLPWVAVSARLHDPIRQTLAVLKDSTHNDAALRFASYLTSPAAREILKRHGILPAAIHGEGKWERREKREKQRVGGAS